MKLDLRTAISQLPRVGTVMAKRLARLGIATVHDLLYHFPARYQDLGTVTPIASLQPDTTATVQGTITIIANKRAFRRRMYITEALINDETGTVKAVWFNQPFITRMLAHGDRVYLSGKVENSNYGLQLSSPIYEKEKKEQTHTGRIVPIYSLTENLTAKQLRFLTKAVLPLAEQVIDWVPEAIRKIHSLIPLPTALKEVHFPTNLKTLAQARRRLKFDELFLIQLKTQEIRQRLRLEHAPAITFDEEMTKEFVDSLPFILTPSQKRAAWDILQDMRTERPMNRLLQGDVGSGKTVVAALVMLNVVSSGYQAAIMAPTEILAKQHYRTVRQLFEGHATSVALLTRTDKKIDDTTLTNNALLKKISEREVDIIIGTHAIIQDKVAFQRLGLIVVDEQHRFGVEQRKKLKQKAAPDGQTTPHFLSMTATPIPRSLALTVYGDLDLSTMLELPTGRKKIKTFIVPPEKRQPAYDFVRKEIQAGRQAFVICPLIEESDKLGVKAATAEYDFLRQEVYSDLSVGLLHGRLKADAKERVMREFAENKIKILVATSVVEVGIDVPNASVMVIEGAERFGLAQLHQLRGRVGRAEHQSYCLVFTDSDSDKTMQRLKALVTAKNGFELAEYDLEFRGPGEVYGLKQSGFPDLTIAKLTDFPIIEDAKKAAEAIMSADSMLERHPLIKEKLQSYQRNVHLE